VAQRSFNADAVAQFSAKLNAQYSNPEKSAHGSEFSSFKSLDFFLQNFLIL
jgi:hypothetical protein